MREIALPFCAVLALLLPIGSYCLILAVFHRRGKPLIVSGAWDAVGLLLAGGGFFLVTLPILFTEFYLRTLGADAGDRLMGVWMRHWLLWLIYFLMLISGSSLMILWRTHKTMIYNVDAAQLPKAMERALALVNLTAVIDRQRMILTPRVQTPELTDTGIPETTPRPEPVAGAADHRYAELVVESFPAMAHVTLHWDNYAPEVRAEIERELDVTLELAAPLDNPAAGWFLSISGLVLGVVIMIFLAVGFLLVFSRP